jgi:hypothetical protein
MILDEQLMAVSANPPRKLLQSQGAMMRRTIGRLRVALLAIGAGATDRCKIIIDQDALEGRGL